VNIGQIFFTIITQPIFNGLMLLYHLFGDFGLSIVVLTLIIKLILFPLTVKSLKSMKATQALQPKLVEIRQKYKNDQQAQMQAMQALYKEHGVSPAAGCLPMLVQLPVLYGLFFALESGLGSGTPQQIMNHVNSQLYSFVPHFTTPPDVMLKWFTFINPAFQISLARPDSSHILPILAGIATFVQLRMSQARQANNAPANDPTTQSMKMMQYVMPLVTVFIGWSFAAGLALYWTVSYIFQAVQQYFVTGWGSLLDIPGVNQGTSSGKSDNKKSTTRVVEGSIAPNKTAAKSSQNGKTASQSRPFAQSDSEVEETEDEEEEIEQPISKSTKESRMRNISRGSGSSQYNRRRQRGSSASARRRSSTRSRS
jgi:YidC/Oxa1 family membrane protein insertase